MFDLTHPIQNVISTGNNIKNITKIFKIMMSIRNLLCILHLELSFGYISSATCGHTWQVEATLGSTVLVLWRQVYDFASRTSEAEPFSGLTQYRSLQSVWVNSNANSSWRASFGFLFVFRYLCRWEWIMGTWVSGKAETIQSRCWRGVDVGRNLGVQGTHRWEQKKAQWSPRGTQQGNFSIQPLGSNLADIGKW